MLKLGFSNDTPPVISPFLLATSRPEKVDDIIEALKDMRELLDTTDEDREFLFSTEINNNDGKPV